MPNDFPLRIPLTNHSIDRWAMPHNEGELSLDIYETSDAIIVKAPLAGVSANHLEISLHQDLLTIRGSRERENMPPDAVPLASECFWGKFSRSVLLPHPTSNATIRAELKNGLLTITLPKISSLETKISVHETD